MVARMFVVFTFERSQEIETPSQIRGKCRIERGYADRQLEDLHDRFGV